MTSNKSYKFTTGSVLLGLKLSAGKPNGCSSYSCAVKNSICGRRCFFCGVFALLKRLKNAAQSCLDTNEIDSAMLRFLEWSIIV